MMKDFIKRYSIKELKNDIRKYGFNYKTKDFIIESLLIILAVIFISIISHLKIRYVLILILLSILLIPSLIHAWFKQNYNIKRFTLLTEYLTNIIPIFIQKAKIRYVLGELFEITSGQMKDVILKAINYIDNTVDDPDLHKNALKIIEKEFPNSRVISVHKLLLSIEASNSIAYEDVCANMYEDIEKWVKRVFTFQKDLKNRRNKLLVLCLMTLFMNSLFVFLYTASEYFSNFIYEPIYQISSLIFIILILIVITIILTKLHGEWLINDIDYLKDEYTKNKYLLYKKGKPKLKVLDYLFALIFLSLGIYLIFINKMFIALICIIVGIFILFKPTLDYKKAYKVLNKAFTIEFPVWLREISLNLNNYTVLNAIECSQNSASFPLRKEIRLFLDETKKDPTSVKPYNDFLNDFDLEDARSSMKVLYAVQNIGKEDMKRRISNLIDRNQELLDKGENIRNKDSIGGIETIAFVPTMLLTIQMLISMLSLFIYMMSTIGQSFNL